MNKKWFLWFTILTLLLVLALGIALGVLKYRQDQQKTAINCSGYSVDQCLSPNCVVCPPCPECSSLSCQSETFCKSMGIDSRWYDAIKKQNNK